MPAPFILNITFMKNIELLPISPDAQKRISEFAAQYRKMSRIYIEVVSFNGQRLIVRAEQKEAVNDKILTKKELTERVREMFMNEVPDDWKLTVSAVNFDRRDIAAVDDEWLRRNMERLNLKAKDIISYTGIDKSTLSLYMSGDRPMSKLAKAAFYYFFKYYEMTNFK